MECHQRQAAGLPVLGVELRRPPVPHHPEAELAIIGEMVAIPDIVPEVGERLEPGDFYDRTCSVAFELMAEAWKNGSRLDAVALRQQLDDAGRPVTQRWLIDAMGLAGGWAVHAELVAADRARRDGLAAVVDAQRRFRSAEDPGDVRDDLVRSLEMVEGQLPRPWAEYKDQDDWLTEDGEDLDPWVLPGLLRRKWRVIIVAAEGAGKTTLLRQIMFLASQGIQPLSLERMPHKCRVLYVDLENSSRSHNVMIGKLKRSMGADYTPGNMKLLSLERGINLRARTDRLRFESMVMDAFPSLVLIGPVYKLYSQGRETDEAAVNELQRILDDFRIRYQFGLIMETHAPHGHAGQREMRAYGTSLWKRWPELGLGFNRDEKRPRTLDVSRWRYDREPNSWPEHIDMSDRWPWVGRWDDPEGWRQARLG